MTKRIQNRSGCCKYCKKADTCMLSYIFPIGEITLAKTMGDEGWALTNDVYAAVEGVLNKKGIYCTAHTDSCPYCIKHKDSGCYEERDNWKED